MVTNEQLGELMDEYSSVLQTIEDTVRRSKNWGVQLRSLSFELEQSEPYRLWNIADKGLEKRYSGQRNEVLARETIGQICDTLEELKAARTRKGEIDATLKQLGRESLIRNL